MYLCARSGRSGPTVPSILLESVHFTHRFYLLWATGVCVVFGVLPIHAVGILHLVEVVVHH